MPPLHTFGEDPIVPFQTRDRYKHLQLPTPDRSSKYDSVNGHSYINNPTPSTPDLFGGYGNHHGLQGQGQSQGQGYRRSSLVTSWRENIPEDTEVEYQTPVHGRFEHQDQHHTLASSRSVPAFATGALTAGLSSIGQATQSRNSKLSPTCHQG